MEGTGTGRSNISETMTYIIKIPTANLRHLWQEVYLVDSNNERQSEMATKPEILICLKLWKVQLKFQRQIWSIRPGISVK